MAPDDARLPGAGSLLLARSLCLSVVSGGTICEQIREQIARAPAPSPTPEVVECGRQREREQKT